MAKESFDASSVDGRKLIALFTVASARLKYPRLRINSPDRKHTLVVYKPASNASNAGGLTFTNGARYGDSDNLYYGKIDPYGHFFPSTVARSNPWVMETLEALIKDPLAKSVFEGKRTGYCCFCSRELTNKISIAHGYGPICADNFGLPWDDPDKEYTAPMHRSLEDEDF